MSQSGLNETARPVTTDAARGVLEHMDGKPTELRSDNGLAARLGTAGVMVLGVLFAVAGLYLSGVWYAQVWLLGWAGLFLGVSSVVLAYRGRPWLAAAFVAVGAIVCLAAFAQWVSGWN